MKRSENSRILYDLAQDSHGEWYRLSTEKKAEMVKA